jgi:membrane-bound ClpP family serine protease
MIFGMPVLTNLSMLQIGSFEEIAIVVLIILVIGIVGWGLWSVVWALTKKPVTGSEALVGKGGVAIQDFHPDNMGEVTIDGIIWKARASDGSKISKGDSVIVVGYSELTVSVKKAPA